MTIPSVGRVVAICNQKGGVGKTTTALNLSACLAERGLRVLAVDVDPQGALTVGLGVDSRNRNTVYDLMLGNMRDPREAVVENAYPGVDLIPANIDLAAAEIQLVGEVAREHALRRVIDKIADDYNAVLIDSHPSLGLLTVNALTASDGVIVPVECEYFALRGLALLLDTVEKIRDRLNNQLELYGILATMYDPRTLHSREVLERLRSQFPGDVLDTVISRTVKFPDASLSGQPLIAFAPGHSAAETCRGLAAELIRRGVFPSCGR